jgi:hypothetical protein
MARFKTESSKEEKLGGEKILKMRYLWRKSSLEKSSTDENINGQQDKWIKTSIY